MNLAMFGISGSTGQALARAAIARGHNVSGLVRAGAPDDSLSGACHIVHGELRDPVAIESTLRGADAVYCLFGPRPPHRDVFCAAATLSIVDAMRRAGIRRLICQTGAMIAPTARNVSAPMRFMAEMFRRQRPAVALDREKQDRIVEQSGLDWTIVKPPRLSGGAKHRGGSIAAGSAVRVGLVSSICRSDLAELLLDLAESPGHVRERIYVAARRHG